MRAPSGADEARTLKIVLAINVGMFVAEVIAAVMADSSALLADSLDMFADATVYGIALVGVHRARATQLKAARQRRAAIAARRGRIRRGRPTGPLRE